MFLTFERAFFNFEREFLKIERKIINNQNMNIYKCKRQLILLD